MSRKTPLALLAAAVLLVVAMAGSATATALITGKDVKNGSLTGKDIKNGSVAAADVKNNLTGTDVKDGSLSGSDVADGSLAEGDLAAGVTAKLNAPSVAGYEVRSATRLLESDGEGSTWVACTTGKVAVGGGGYFEDSDTTETSIEGSIPQRVLPGDDQLFTDPQPGLANGWRVDGKHTGLDPQNLTAYVICVDPS